MTEKTDILYIEDERPILELVRHALKMSGYKVRGAVSGKQGLEMMREQKPDVLLLDLMMPGVNGWDVYKKMKEDEELTDIPVMVITATIPERGLMIVENLPPVDDYITKPFDMGHLLRSVRRLL